MWLQGDWLGSKGVWLKGDCSSSMLGLLLLGALIFEDNGLFEAEFDRYCYRFKKAYDDPFEKARRLAFFAENTREIKEHNKNKDRTFDMEVNKFTDFSAQEMNALRGLRRLEVPETGALNGMLASCFSVH